MREEMEKRLTELTTLTKEMILEIGALKERIARLESGGHPLPEVPRSTPDGTNEPSPGKAAAAVREAYIAMRGENYEHLGALYNEGFHICHAAFAQPRSDECLFCIGLLNRV